MSEYDDLGAQVAVVKELLDRVYGKPKQAVALTGDGGGPMLLRIGMLLDARSEQLADELADRLALEEKTGEGGELA